MIYFRRISLILLFFYALNVFPQEKIPILTAHRGACAQAPENSLSAISLALNSNVHRIEVDIRLTKDGIPILMHDKRINRTSNGKGKVKNMTLNELSQFYLRINDSITNEHIPTLEDVLKLNFSSKHLLLEIKNANRKNKNIAHTTVTLVNKYNLANNIIIQSFSDKILNEVRLADTNLCINKIIVYKSTFFPFLIDNSVRFKTLRTYHYVESFAIHHVFASRRFIKKTHKLNKQVFAWTVNSEKRKQKLLIKGVDGFISDNVP